MEGEYIKHDGGENCTTVLVRKTCWKNSLKNWTQKVVCVVWMNLAQDRVHWEAFRSRQLTCGF
jgi:hypothetical protein